MVKKHDGKSLGVELLFHIKAEEEEILPHVSEHIDISVRQEIGETYLKLKKDLEKLKLSANRLKIDGQSRGKIIQEKLSH